MMGWLMAAAAACDGGTTWQDVVLGVGLAFAFAICFAAWRFTGGSFDF